MVCLLICAILAGCGSKKEISDPVDMLENTKEHIETAEDDRKDEVTSESKKLEKEKESDEGTSIEEDLPEEEILEDASDDIDYEAVYEPVFEEVLDVINYGYNIDREYDFLAPGIADKVEYSGDDDLLDTIGYLIQDMSGDGVPELLIGCDEEYGKGPYSYIYSVCAIKDDNPVSSFAGSSRASYLYMGEGQFYYEASGGTGISIFGENHLSWDGSELIWDDFFFTDTKEDGETGFYHNDTGVFDISKAEELNMSGKQFFAIKQDYDERFELIPWTPIGDHSKDTSENIHEINGDPENIEKMFSDMRDFITDCNNIIRKK